MRGETPGSLPVTRSRRQAARGEFVATFDLPTERATLVLMRLFIRRYCSCPTCRETQRMLAVLDHGRHAPVVHYGESQRIKRGDFTLDCLTRRVLLAGVDLHVTCYQFRLLKSLCDADGAVVTYDELSQALYGQKRGNDRERIIAHVRRTRRLIEADPSHPERLVTVRGEGFRLAT